jgi:hypothetical protein
VALVLLVGGGLLLRTFVQLQRVDLGFDPTNVLVGFVVPHAGQVPDERGSKDLLRQILERASALPGVRTAALTSVVPLSGGDSDMSFTIEGTPPPRTADEAPATWVYRLVSAGYLEGDGDSAEARAERRAARGRTGTAHQRGNGEAPLGRTGSNRQTHSLFRRFTLVHHRRHRGDVKQQGARPAPRAQTFIPYWHLPEPGITVVLKTASQPETLTMPLRQAVRAVDPDIPVTNIAAMTSLVSESIEEPRFLAMLVGLFAGLALLLAAIGNLRCPLVCRVAARRGDRRPAGPRRRTS